MAAGRPPCPLCGLPLDPEGHICPRQNGATGADRRRLDDAEHVAQPDRDASTLGALLRDGELEIEGRLVDASNATLYCSVALDGIDAAASTSRSRASGPLWDFPDGTLAGREVAAYLVSAATGWDVVPPTVLRDGPFGPGMCQLWIDVDEAVDLAALARSDHPDLRRMAVFDAVVNNADRKGGHLLPTPTATSTASTTASASPSRTSCARCCGSGAASR